MYFISSISEKYPTHEKAIAHALELGCKLVQLRMKDSTTDERTEIARRILESIEREGAKLIIDDDVEAVVRSNAHGIHIGKNDISIREARKLLGDKIVGATANTLEDVIRAFRDGADYVGLGPYRFTQTKKNLSPILGLDGVRQIIRQARAAGVSFPIYPIGGITQDDIPLLMEAGASDVALSSSLLK